MRERKERWNKVAKNMKSLQTKGKYFFLAYDQGLEHGPSELPGNSLYPEYIFSLAEKGRFNGLIVHKGLAEKYGAGFNVNLIIKVNGKTCFRKGEPYSPVICSVKRAVELSARAIGFTIYPGSEYENTMYEDLAKVQEEAHYYGLPVIVWAYPRGKAVKNELGKNVLSYATRIGLEMGADMLKVKYNGNKEDLKENMSAAGDARILCAGGEKTSSSKEFLKKVAEVNEAGVNGFAIGRNIWQHDRPLKITEAVKDIIYDNKDIYQALKRLE